MRSFLPLLKELLLSIHIQDDIPQIKPEGYAGYTDIPYFPEPEELQYFCTRYCEKGK